MRTEPFESVNLPILLLGTLGTIRRRPRLEKLAFLCDMEIFKKIKVYDDWLPYMFGPFSTKLHDDMSDLASRHIVAVNTVEGGFEDGTCKYSLTSVGRKKYGQLLAQYVDKVARIHEMLLSYNYMETTVPLMERVYKKYPKFSSSMLTYEEATNARNGS